MRRASRLRLTGPERRKLAFLARSGSTPKRVALRARLVLRAASGAENRTIADELRTSPGTVGRWRKRFAVQRIPGIERDAPRPGRPPVVPTSTIQLIVRRGRTRAASGSPRPSVRDVARQLGVSKTTVLRVWKAHQVPSRPQPGPLPPEPGPEFADKVTDFVGLYLDPPHRAMAFSVDERSPQMAGDRRPKRSGAGASELRQAAEFRRFLQEIDRETPGELEVHLLVDNRVTPGLLQAQRWLARHPRFHLHVLPPKGPSPNLIDQLLREFTSKHVRSGTPASAVRLHRAVRQYFASQGGTHGPFVWTANAEEIRSGPGRRPNTIGYYWTNP
ncbi:MAG TPA: helix-turn-helix domain-containing protein [Thermoplasmata archaeon]|nr:helix-turn-helix domain-containing protein [Thermoplasmata archaeon]